MVSAERLWSSPSWSADHFLGPAAVAFQAGAEGVPVSELGGECIEGWRVSETPGAAAYDPRVAHSALLRQANITSFRFQLDDDHFEPPRISERWCVRPEDVVLNKLTPVRAAVAPSQARRHPVDGNCLIVRGLSRENATWLATCLNHVEYEKLLGMESGILERVGIGSLSRLRLPKPPAELEGLSASLLDVLDAELQAGEALHHVRAEAARETDIAEKSIPLREGSLVPGASLSSESWLPASIGFSVFLERLARRHGWVPLRSLATVRTRVRFSATPENARTLRLGDVASDLFVPGVAGEAGPQAQPARTFREPLTRGEVLASTQATSLRTVFIDESAPANSFPTDSWLRLNFQETPAAWAVLLSTPGAQSQMRHLAVGTARQFVSPDALLSVHLPDIDARTRERWQSTVERHHERRRVIERDWSDIRAGLERAYRQVHDRFTIRSAQRRTEGEQAT